ncbi:DedA family protein [Brevibacterium casei]|uniref:DedA family protein n=2 Tax=Brevibacterium casei TaxID=33889 RepID=A0A269ZF32_9MICO|nr:DedA family protein [Brevibacterium casei]MBE4694018.1 DedA family protein [Brevibacterium casei]MBY3577141.1 DedA family protein [Brevibacterium casei]MCT1549163.1 DedA family protein [Brevibacterium casei]MCT1561685.1 DedA family protein [Brevibacterium casei]MCT1766562.1 DedA family protein [Brevibacterium casei]
MSHTAALAAPGLLMDTVASGAAENLSGFSAWTVRIMETLGPIGVGFLVFLDNIFPPIPSELVLPLAGFTASRGQLSLVLAIVFATIGSVVGAVLLYAIGRWIGLDRIVRVAVKMPLVDVADVHKTVSWFDRHGDKAVFFGRMIPIFRSLISIPAGMRAMPMVKFILLTAAGSTIWNTVLIVAGFLLGENWSIVETYAGYFQTLVIAVVVIAVVVWIVLKVRSRRRRSRAETTEA